MTTIAVCQAWDSNYQPMADITWTQNKKLYCDHWGYPYHIKTDGFTYNVSYEKIKLLLDVMNNHPEYDWVYWAGTDTLITNFYIKLETFVDDKYNIIIAKDINDINADCMLVKNTEESREYLEYIWSLAPKYNDHSWWEQQAMIDSMDKYEHLFKFISQKSFNSFLYKQLYGYYGSSIDKTGNDGQWEPGDFLLHIPGMPKDQKISVLAQFMGLVRHIVE